MTGAGERPARNNALGRGAAPALTSGDWARRLLLVGLLFAVPPFVALCLPEQDGQELTARDASAPATNSDVGTDAAERGGDAASVLVDTRRPLPDVAAHRIALQDLEGPPAEIADESGEAMAHFYAQLLAVARGDAETLARVVLISDSLNGCDRVSGNLRRALQERFGDGGKGFVPVAPGWGSQEHEDVTWSYRLWRATRINLGTSPGGRYGLGGVLAENRSPRAQARFGALEGASDFTLFRLFYQAWPEGGVVELSVDDGDAHRIPTRAAAVEDRIHTVELPDGGRELAVSVAEGDLRLYGVVLERLGPGVVVDGLPYIGATVRMMRHWDGAHLAEQVREREADLLVFWIGANDVRAASFGHDRYVADYGEYIAALRAGRPEASCLVMAEPDQAVERDGQLRSRRRVPQIVAAQAATAAAQGCAFFDLHAALGGRGTAPRWYRGSPRLIVGDYLHLTAAGASVVARRLELALLRGFDEHLAVLEADPGGR